MKHKPSNKLFVLKRLNKRNIDSEKHLQLVLNEKAILKKVEGEFLIKCHETLSDEHGLYFVLDYTPGGELKRFIRSTLGRMKRDAL